MRTAFFAILLVGVSCTKEITEQIMQLGNKVPVANAGPSKTILEPLDSVVVVGSGSDSAGHIVAYLWSKVSGPPSYFIVNPGSATTSIKNLTPGTYIFQLMVTDNDGATGVDTMSVRVNALQQQTLTLQPANNPGERILVLNNGVDESSSNTPDLPVEAWTVGGNPLFVRALLKFDLSSIPANAQIVNATLSLYSYPDPPLNGNLVNANFGSSNALLVQRVTSSWTTPGWANQPTTTTTNQVVVPHTNQSNLDLNINVTQLLSSMVSTNTNYGFLVRLQTEVTYNSRIMVASDNTTYTSKHPKLTVTYTQ